MHNNKPKVVIAGCNSPPFDMWHFLFSRFPRDLSQVTLINKGTCPPNGEYDDKIAERNLRWTIYGEPNWHNPSLEGGCHMYIGIRTQTESTPQLGERGEDMARKHGKQILMLDTYDKESICEFVAKQIRCVGPREMLHHNS